MGIYSPASRLDAGLPCSPRAVVLEPLVFLTLAKTTVRSGSWNKMIIARTPFRISFFGGGTDYPAWYREHGGAVLATSIDKYCYLSCRFMPPFFDTRYRTVYSKIELTHNIDEIEHPAVRAALHHMNFDGLQGTEIVHYADLPGRTGLGSSSSFCVGLLQALSALRNQAPDKRELAKMAIHLEQNVLAESVGSQDQVSAAMGGLNAIYFCANDFDVRPLTMDNGRLEQLQDCLLLVYTGIARFASQIAEHQIRGIDKKRNELHAMRQMVDHGMAILDSAGDLADFGRLLHEAWTLKAGLSEQISNSSINDIYQRARAAGAIGGKLLGAGGGGFMLFYVVPELRLKVIEALSGLLVVPFRFENTGTNIIYHNQQP